MTINEALKMIVSNAGAKLHLNILNNNGIIIAQLYNVFDFNNWELGVQFPNAEGAIIELNFSNSKPDNRLNFERFIESTFFEKFEKPNNIKEKSYFYLIGKSEHRDIEEELRNILKIVYGSEMAYEFKLVSY